MYDRIVFISIDTLRADVLGPAPTNSLAGKYGLPARPQMAVLNRLADQGYYFCRTVSAAPYTSASHASFFSGYWPLHHGLYEFYNRRLAKPTIFTLAKAKGFRTIFKTDFPIILGDRLGFTDDIDIYLIEDDDGFLAALETEGPSLSFVHFGGVHLPYGFHNLKFGGAAYRDKVASLERAIGGFGDLPADQLVETYRSDEDRHYLLCYKKAVEFFYTRRDYKKLMELYLEGVDFFMRTRFDPFMNRLLSALKAARFLIVIFGDHGEEYDDESRGHFDSLNEGVIRVPMIFYGYDVSPGCTEEIVRSIDLVPSLLDRLGWASADLTIDGVSLSDAIWGGGSVREFPVALAQTYVSNASEFLAFQKKVLRGDSSARYMRHMLYKEGAWHGDARLIRQHHAYEDRDKLTGIKPCKLVAAPAREVLPDHYVFDAGVSDILGPVLDKYNRSRARVTAGKIDARTIRNQLADMGYRV